MKLTPEDHAKLKTKQLANIIRKLNEGKTLTAREEAILATSRESEGEHVQSVGRAPLTSGYAKNWDELAQALGVSRKTLQNWRQREDLWPYLPKARADGRHEIAAWARLVADRNLGRGELDAEDDEVSIDTPRTLKDWRAHKEKLLCRRIERDIDKDDNKLLVADPLEVAFGQLLNGVATALHHFPGATARFLVGIRDPHVVQERLEAKMNVVLQRLNAAEYLDDCLAETVRNLEYSPEAEALFDLVVFSDRDRPRMLQLIEMAAREALRAIGRRGIDAALGQGGGQAPAESAPPTKPEAPQTAVADPAAPSTPAKAPAKPRKAKRKSTRKGRKCPSSSPAPG